MKTLHSLLVVAGTALMLAACTGPAGPAGPAGQDGANGADGANGTNGTNGVANITNSITDITGWSFNTSPAYYYAALTNGSITDPNNEQVEVYFGLSNNGPWQAMPGVNLFNSGDQLTFDWTTNAVQINYDYSSLTNVPSDLYVNVLVIPPAVMKRHPGTNWKDASAIKSIPEVEAALNTKK
jgi:hypothetical protein